MRKSCQTVLMRYTLQSLFVLIHSVLKLFTECQVGFFFSLNTHKVNQHYELNICVPSNLYIKILSPQCDSTRKWGLWKVNRFRWGHEGETSSKRLLPLWEEKARTQLLVSTMWEYCKKAMVCNPGSGVLSRTQPWWYLDHRLPRLSTVRRTCVLLKSSILCYFVLGSLS